MQSQKLEELKKYIEELKMTKFLEEQEISSGFLTIKKYICKLNNGKIITREQIIKNERDGSAAIILPVTTEGKIVIVIEPRVFSKETVGVEFPAGYIEFGEKPIEAAKRELIEETGYVPEKLELLVSYYQDQGCSKAFNHSFIALGCKKLKEQNLDPEELIRYMEFTFDEVIELAQMGYINDANSLLALERAKKYF